MILQYYAVRDMKLDLYIVTRSGVEPTVISPHFPGLLGK